ncbi:TIGR03086 family metal-binding protein [Streptomyces sp. NPDC050509]|uniref:TIGR03086 family metal-binding protein n=1 Tax=Streptomyces sp. NPDC050509 TaxID=3365620 RepID=UPI00379376C4
MQTGTAADSPAADPVVAAIVAAWLPGRANSDPTVASDGTEARTRLHEQLAVAAEPAVERFWQLLCVLGGRPVPAGMAKEGRWLITALRTNPAPGARDAQLKAHDTDDTDAWHGGVLDAFTRVQEAVSALVHATAPEQFALPTPCEDWTVRDLLDHLVWENIIWGGLANGIPPTDGHNQDHLGDNHAAAFEASAAQPGHAFRQPGVLERFFGPALGRRMVEQLLIELPVHGWDIATALGLGRDLEPDIARAALPVVQRIYGDLPRTAGGIHRRRSTRTRGGLASGPGSRIPRPPHPAPIAALPATGRPPRVPSSATTSLLPRGRRLMCHVRCPSGGGLLDEAPWRSARSGPPARRYRSRARSLRRPARCELPTSWACSDTDRPVQMQITIFPRVRPRSACAWASAIRSRG